MRVEEILDLDDQIDHASLATATESIPYPVARLGSHVFDDGEIRILKILINQHRNDITQMFREEQLNKGLAELPPPGFDEYGKLNEE